MPKQRHPDHRVLTLCAIGREGGTYISIRCNLITYRANILFGPHIMEVATVQMVPHRVYSVA